MDLVIEDLVDVYVFMVGFLVWFCCCLNCVLGGGIEFIFVRLCKFVFIKVVGFEKWEKFMDFGLLLGWGVCVLILGIIGWVLGGNIGLEGGVEGGVLVVVKLVVVYILELFDELGWGCCYLVMEEGCKEWIVCILLNVLVLVWGRKFVVWFVFNNMVVFVVEVLFIIELFFGDFK